MTLNAQHQQLLINPSAAALDSTAAIHYVTAINKASPSVAALAGTAAIHYITALAAIVEPLGAQRKQLKNKGEKVLSAIESSSGLCVGVLVCWRGRDSVTSPPA